MNNQTHLICMVDLYPARGMFKPGELVRVFLECEAREAGAYTFTVQIFRGLDIFFTRKEVKTLEVGFNKVVFAGLVPGEAPAGYGFEVTYSDTSAVLEKAETTFDVLSDWTSFPRYGFLSDFSNSRTDADETIQTLAKYHINGLQFYDWQYRHDELLPPQDEYLDPLNRPLSLKITRKLIAAAHEQGMAALPYLAVYAASADFWRAHPEWMLYDTEHNSIPFGENFLGIMNPTAGSPWQLHLLAQCQKVLAALPFDGLHIDQYGDPKTGYDAEGQVVEIPQAFGDFVRAASAQHPGRPVLFNAVGNWPINELAASPVAFNYIEVWPPDVKYLDLVRIVRNAHKLSGQKPVVIALYLPAERTINNQLADALIFSAGGTRIELGENGRLLTDPYFPKHSAISEKLNVSLRKSLDCIVRYEEWIGPLVAESTLPELNIPVGVEPFFRETTHGASLCLVNLNNGDELTWNSEHAEPAEYGVFDLEIDLGFTPEKVWLINPDSSTLAPLALEYHVQDGKVRVNVSSLKVWEILLFEGQK